MAIKFMEDFGSNSLARSALAGRWDQNNNSNAALTFSTNAGPFGEGACVVGNGNVPQGGPNLVKTAINGGLTTTVYMSCWFKVTQNSNQVNNTCFGVMNGATNQCTVGINTSGVLIMLRGVGNGTTLATASSIPINQWGWLQSKMVIGTGTNGSVQLKWNGVDIIANTTGLNTANSGVAAADGIFLGMNGAFGNAAGYTLSDFIVNDSSGSNNTGFIAQSRVYFFLPSSNGTTHQFTPLANTNWQEVSNNPDTGDSSYNSSSTATNKDIFNHAALASNVTTILGVQTQHICRIDDAGSHTGQCVLYDGTTEVDSPSSAPALTPAYGWIEQIAETNLTSGLAFTPTDVNNLQFGYKLTT